MQPKVTAVLVARNGDQYLPSTIAALAAQIRRPDSVIFVDSGSSDTSERLLSDAALAQCVTTPGRRSFGGAVAHALQVAAPPAVDNDWLWLLGHDNAPSPPALSALLGAVEVAPSVAVAGPKLMRWDEPGVISSFGETLTRFGRSIAVVTDELDQAQFDIQSDLLGVAAGGMLVRRRVFTELGGFDPALPSVDAALDFCVRVRLAGHRVVGVPSARVSSAGAAELFGRRSLSAGSQNRLHRAAQVHRRLAYAPALAVPLHWLSIVPLAILRSLGHLAAKRPALIGGELAAGIAGAFDTAVPVARRNLRRTRALGWRAVDALRMPWSEVREHRAHDRAVSAPAAPARVGPAFFAGGGAWMVLLTALAGVIAFGRLANATALAGGGLTPLSGNAAELWSHVGYAWRDIGPGFIGAADPFSYLLAVIGSITFWSPSFSIVALYLVAIPLSAVTAWCCAARFSARPWAPAVAALGWALAPPLLASLNGGHLGAVLAHVLLPVLVLATVNAARSWSMAAVAGLLFAAVAASAPVLVPALTIAWLAWLIARPKSILRLIGIPVPAAALFFPVVMAQFGRGNGVALFADPGVPVVNAAPSGWHLLIGSTDAGSAGWNAFLVGIGLSAVPAAAIAAVLLIPLAVLALLALFLPGSPRSIPALLLALMGFATAVIGTHVEVSMVGAMATPIWAGSGLSLYWLGLIGAMVVALEALGTRAALPAIVTGIALALVAVPLLSAAAAGAIAVRETNGRLLPAFVSAEAVTNPTLGTLELAAQPAGGVAVTVHRGPGTTLDEQSTLDATDLKTSAADLRLATLAGNISSRSGFDVGSELNALQLAFVLVPHSSDSATGPARQRITDALNGNRILSPVGDTANGYLWHYQGITAGPAPTGPGPFGTPYGIAVLVGQGIVFALTLLLAIPTTRRRRLRSARGPRGVVELSEPEEAP